MYKTNSINEAEDALFHLVFDEQFETLGTELNKIKDRHFTKNHDLLTLSATISQLLAHNQNDLALSILEKIDFTQLNSVNGDNIKAVMLTNAGNYNYDIFLEALLKAGFDPSLRKRDGKDALTACAEQVGENAHTGVGYYSDALEKHQRAKKICAALMKDGKLRGLPTELASMVIFAIQDSETREPKIKLRELAARFRGNHYEEFNDVMEYSAEFDIPKSFKKLFSNQERMERLLIDFSANPSKKQTIIEQLNDIYGTNLSFTEEMNKNSADLTKTKPASAKPLAGSNKIGSR